MRMNAPCCQIPISWLQYLLFQLINFPLLFDPRLPSPCPPSHSPLPCFTSYNLLSECVSLRINKSLGLSGTTLAQVTDCFLAVSSECRFHQRTPTTKSCFYSLYSDTLGGNCYCRESDASGTDPGYLCRH